ncbi:MAG TPA: T9SS type B sorting domain-containing protein [Cyclobacteriaceae bacterium]
MRRFLLFVICFLGLTAAFGQYTSRLGRFKVDQVKGCAPFTITITDTNVVTTGDCTPGKPCLMDFEGKGATSTNRFTYTYPAAGTYKLSVLYQSIGADDITVTVVDNKPPTFQVFSCTNNKVTVKVVDKSYDMYLINFNSDATVDATIPSGNNATAQFDYGAPGNYTITVRGKNVNSADNCQNLTDTYQTLTTLPTPTLNTLTALDANNLKLDLTSTKHIEYKLNIGINNGTTFQAYQELYQQTTLNIPNLLVDNNYYCFQLSAFDPCANTNTFSNTICSQDFDVTFNNGSNDLAWKTATGATTSVEVKRNGSTYTTIPGAPLNYSDKDYDCNANYCYQITANYPGGAKSISLSKCGVGVFKTTFPAIDNITSIVRVGAELSWKPDPKIKIEAFDVMKSVFRQPFGQVAEIKVPNYTDDTYDYAGGSCYQVNYHDLCKNQSLPGIVACPMALTGSMDDKNAITLTWNKYKGYKNGVSTYLVDKFTKDAVLIGTYPTTDTTFFDYDPADNNQVVIYRIRASATDAPLGVLESISNNITLQKPIRLILPTAFTPNGDGINPSFSVSGKFIAKMSIMIFDRWGVLVYESDKNEPWNGTKDGRAMPESAYVWKAEGVDTAGNSFTKEGTVILLRPRQ